MSIRMIAMDLDGTLLNNQKSISPRSAAALRRAAEEGYYVVPATGRCLAALPGDLDLRLCPYLLLSNGALVLERDTGKQLYRATIPKETLRQCFNIIDRNNALCNFIAPDRSYMYEPHFRAFPSITTIKLDDFWINTIYKRQTPFSDFDRWLEEVGSSILKINLFFRDMNDREIIREELKKLPGLDICSSISGDLEVTNCEATKGLGLKALADYLHLDPEEIIAFGDSDNDITMIQSAGVGVAMANAVPELLAAADRVTLSNTEDGVAWGLEQWVFHPASEVKSHE